MSKKPTKVEIKQKEDLTIKINPNLIKVRDMRGINLTGCGFHTDKKKKANKKACRRKFSDDYCNAR